MKKLLTMLLLASILTSCDSTSSLYTVSSRSTTTLSVPAEEDVYKELTVQRVGVKGDGEMDESGQGIFGRRIYKTPSLSAFMYLALKGKVVCTLCINQQGKVTYAESIPDEWTIRDEEFISKALKVVMN